MKRTIYVADEALWQQAQAIARQDGVSMSALIARVLARELQMRANQAQYLDAGD